MSRAAELVSMLTARGLRIGHIPGGMPTLTASDVAGAIGLCLNPFEASLILSRYALDAQQYGAARAHWFESVMDQKKRSGWTSEGPGHFKRMADITLEEWVQDNNCRACMGVGSVMIASKKVDCQACEGTGKKYMSERRLGAAIGVGRTAFANQWKARVDWCRKELVRVEMTAIYRLDRALKSGVDKASQSV